MSNSHQRFETTGWRREPKTPITSAESAPSLISTSPPANLIVTEGYRGVRIMVIGDTALDDCDVVIYGVERTAQREGEIVYITSPLARVDTVVIGTTACVGELGSPTELFADTYTTIVGQAHGTGIYAYSVAGATATSTPTGNGIGWCGASDIIGQHGIVVGFPTLNTGNYFSYCYTLEG